MPFYYANTVISETPVTTFEELTVALAKYSETFASGFTEDWDMFVYAAGKERITSALKGAPKIFVGVTEKPWVVGSNGIYCLPQIDDYPVVQLWMSNYITPEVIKTLIAAITVYEEDFEPFLTYEIYPGLSFKFGDSLIDKKPNNCVGPTAVIFTNVRRVENAYVGDDPEAHYTFLALQEQCCRFFLKDQDTGMNSGNKLVLRGSENYLRTSEGVRINLI